MNIFIGIAALLTLLALAWFVRPLLRSSFAQGVSSQKLNAAIHRDQLAALEADLARGAISQQDFESTRDELQLRLLDDTQSEEIRPAAKPSGFWTGRRTAGVVAVFVPVLAIGMYLKLGAPAAIDPVATAQGTHEQMQQMIDTLAARLKANPDNPKGWIMLARSYKMMGRFNDARDAFDKAHDLVNTEPDLLVDYADVLAVLANNNLDGKPMEMVNKALALNPQHPMGLMMAGVAAYRRSDFKLAVAQWEKLLAQLEPGSTDAQQVEDNIADARAKAGMPASARSASAGPSNKMPPIPEGAGAGMTPEMINQMVDKLATRLKEKPDDPAGWAQLARAYKVQGRNAEAEQAYSRTGKLLDTDPELITQYVDLMVGRTKGDFKGEPTRLINKALTINPKHPIALMMAGQAAYQAGDYSKAIGHWETVLKVLPPGSPDIEPVKNEIADAKARMAKK